MSRDRLFKALCTPEVIRIGWHLAQHDSRDDFVTDPVGHADFACNLEERLRHVIEQLETFRYRPRHLLEVDVPKSGLSVRPGNVLPIEEASLLHAIVYLLAPHLDKRLDDSVFSYRLHPEWQRKVKNRESLFREAPITFPFLRRKTVRSLNPFEAWYEVWPEFEAEAVKAYTEEGYTHLTKTDITAYFENIDLRLLENQIRSLLKREEERLLQVLFRVLEGWTRVTSTGSPIGRGIPQGNEVSSFLGNLYLLPLDRSLKEFSRKYDAKWFRYVDDVKVFTKSERDARQAVFVINEALRGLHLNLQGSKTEILSGRELEYELDGVEFDLINDAIRTLCRLNHRKPEDRKLATACLKPLRSVKSRFTSKLPVSVASLDGKQNRLFRRVMTAYGMCRRPQLRPAAVTAIRQLPDMRVLLKSLNYLSQLEYRFHDETLDDLLSIIGSGELPFPYQVAMVIEAVGKLHPLEPKGVASRVRSYALRNKHHWLVVQRALETITVYPYRPGYALNLGNRFLKHNHPLVRRAACVLLTRSPKDQLRKRMSELIHHADPGVSRLALYLQRFYSDKQFAAQELSRLRKSRVTDFGFQQNVHRLFALAATEDPETAANVHTYVASLPTSKSPKIAWLRNCIADTTAWAAK